MFNTEQPHYQALRNIVAERTSSLVAWVGSGLSTPAGLPTWPALRQRLSDAVRTKARELDPPENQRLLNVAQQADEHDDPWNAFSILKEALGQTSYRCTVKEALAPPRGAAIPPLYTKLWLLRPSGFLNLNLDRFASIAHIAREPCPTLHEFSGRDAAKYIHLLQSTDPFVANLHGVIDDQSTWVLTKGELRHLFHDDGYQLLIKTVLASRTVIFVGITADDTAAGGHLSQLTNVGITVGDHFWITPRRDTPTSNWAERAGLRLIHYSSHDEDHFELEEALHDLITYLPDEIHAPPVAPTRAESPATSIPTPAELRSKSPEDARTALNAHAAALLATTGKTQEEAYERFCRTYQESIYGAWFVSTDPPHNIFLGHRLIERIAAGAFGRVYRAQNPDGREVAIKVLRHDIRNEPGMLQSFRRGVRSMEILSQRQVTGMVPYLDAWELPTCVTMELIEGPNLQTAVTSRLVNDWPTILRIACELTDIIRAAHHLPERVLHRDIRPANVMLKGFHEYADAWTVVVLDFDLSWHRGALGVSIQQPTAVVGYLAPEQVAPSPRQSTRNALVDSFGLGMTLYYLRSGRDPQFAQHKHTDWRPTLTNLVTTHPCPNWASLPRRFARVIEWATKDTQSARWDMAQISGELHRLRNALDLPTRVESAELLAEELAARSVMQNRYEWKRDSYTASLSLPTGVKVDVRGNEAEALVSVDIAWLDRGDAHRSNIGKWLPAACDKVGKELRRQGFKVDVIAKTRSHTHISGTVPVQSLRSTVDKAASALSKAIEAFQMK